MAIQPPDTNVYKWGWYNLQQKKHRPELYATPDAAIKGMRDQVGVGYSLVEIRNLLHHVLTLYQVTQTPVLILDNPK